MKRLLLISTAAIALSLPAHAQVVTISPAELVQLANQLTQLQQSYQAALAIFGSLSRSIDPNTIASGLIGSQSLPGVGQIGGMLTGGGNFGSLSGLAQQYLGSNTVYTPQSLGPNDYNAAYMQRYGNTMSGVQAMSQQSIGNIQTHISGIAEIQQQLSSGSVVSSADVQTIHARLAAEQANLTAETAQAQALNTMLVAQNQQYQLQDMQNNRRSADELLQSVTGGGGNGLRQPTLTVPTFGG